MFTTSQQDYSVFFKKNKKYYCEVIYSKGTCCQLKVGDIPIKVLGTSKSFKFPARPIFDNIVGWEGKCEVRINPQGGGLIAENVVLVKS